MTSSRTRIVHHHENPITRHYDLLWADVRRGDGDNHSIQNTLRKILEREKIKISKVVPAK